jgi:hypothetical protein
MTEQVRFFSRKKNVTQKQKLARAIEGKIGLRMVCCVWGQKREREKEGEKNLQKNETKKKTISELLEIYSEAFFSFVLNTKSNQMHNIDHEVFASTKIKLEKKKREKNERKWVNT